MRTGNSSFGPVRSVLSATLAAVAMMMVPMAAPAQEIVSEVVDYAGDEPPPLFESSEAAIQSFKDALEGNDIAGLAALLGLKQERLMNDASTLEAFVQIRDGAAQRLVPDERRGVIVLEIGENLWPFPFPIVSDDIGNWSFDTYAGLQEIVNRRVGENEHEAIATARAFVDAQHEYARADRDGDGVYEFAQKLISSEGQTDGLYWPYTPETGDSPAGSFVNEAALETTPRQGYFGYRYKVLTGQGDNIAGGAHSYLINGNMIAGFALIAWPVEYGITGAHTFVVNQHGTVYEKDLGLATGDIVHYIDSFNPDEGWAIATD